MKVDEEQLRALVAGIVRVPPETIRRETRFVQDLAMDSLASLDVLTELEEVHGIVITQDDARHLSTFGALLDHVAKLG